VALAARGGDDAEVLERELRASGSGNRDSEEGAPLHGHEAKVVCLMVER